jgi:Ca-activated chloride channel family protein
MVCGGDLCAQALLHPPSDLSSVAAPVVTAPPAATTSTTGSGSVFRSAVDLVSLNVIVTDARDRFVAGLEQKDFAVYEDGVPQELSFFAAANVPLDLAILIDTSSSMTEKMPTVKKAAIGFASHLREGDRAMVVGIKESARTLHPLDLDLSGARQAISQATASGSTALYNALYTTIKQMRKVHAADGDVRRQAIAVLTDGDDTASLVTFDDLLALAKDAGVAIYTISLRSQYAVLALTTQYSSESLFAMKALAQETGARSFFPTDISQLDGVYASITEELANQYALGYTSKNPHRDGTFHRINVRLAAPNTRTRTRSGYQTTTTQSTQASLNK